MSERIEYEPTAQGIDITIPKELGDKLLTIDGRTIPRILRLYDLPEESRMFEFIPGEESYDVRMYFDRLATANNATTFANFTRQLSAVHREIVETASGSQRSDAAEVRYTDAPVRSGGVYGMAALLHWPEKRFDETALKDAVLSSMGTAAAYLLDIPRPEIPGALDVRLNRGVQSKMMIGEATRTGLIGPYDFNPNSEAIAMSGASMTTDAQQLVSIAGLAAFAHFRKSNP